MDQFIPTIDASHSIFNSVGGDQYNQYNLPAPGARSNDSQYVLESLQPAHMDASDRTECLDGTRSSILQTIMEWVAQPAASQNVLWLHALAGAGKSTLATTIANRFREAGCLGAFVFFNRDASDSSHPSTVIKTLAYQAGLSHARAGNSIAAAIRSNPGIHLYPLRIQFQKLLVDPLSFEGVLDMEKPLLFILDALDECGCPGTRALLLDILAENTIRLPVPIRLIITSRPQRDICNALNDQPHILPYELDIASDANALDISWYLCHRLMRIYKKTPQLWKCSVWPEVSDIEKLAELASGLFVWASTASEFIDGYDPRARKEIILKGHSGVGYGESLDSLYRIALESAGDWHDALFVTDFTAVIGLALTVRRPLSSAAIDLLLGPDECRPCCHILSHLRSVLQHEPNVRFLHPSFADFLLTKSRSGRDVWYFDQRHHNALLASRCLHRLQAVLKKNMLNLTLSSDIINEILPDDISYACAFWVDHICAVEDNMGSVIEQLEIFLNRHLLHWIESMSILRKSRDTVQLLERLEAWICIYDSKSRILQLLGDAQRFVQVFASDIEDHPLLVYVTALPFAPVNTTIYQAFCPSSNHLSVIVGTRPLWSPLLLSLAGHTDSVMSVTFSRRGSLIASSSCDRTVRVWDARSGASILPPLRGHDGGVWCVAFSPDGACIASGSFDIRLWDVATGAETTPPMCGHASAVLSVAFSPDGERLVSSSYDSTIRTWDIKMGIACLPPITGHAEAVRSVTFSSDGKHLLSGSDDRSIILWDASTGTMMQRLKMDKQVRHKWIYNSLHQVAGGKEWIKNREVELQRPGKTNKLADDMSVLPTGHTASVRSVNFSPDGNCLVSGSDDGSIMLWDASPGKETKNLSDLPGVFSQNASVSRGGQKHATWRALHSDGVRSVAFSPNGCHIASASADKSVVIWNPDSKGTIGTALQGHGDVVTSVAFSPDGSRLASGSLDNTIRVWDVNLSVVDIQERHTYQILSLEFSPDGTRLVSGSSDGKVNVWDTHSGQPTFPAIPVSANKPVYQVAFSPDGTCIVSCSPTVPTQAASHGRTSLDLHDAGDEIGVWDAVTGSQLSTMRRLRQSGALPVSFSTNGKRIHSDIPDDFTYISQRGDTNNVYYASDMLRLKRSGTRARVGSRNILSQSNEENYSEILYIPPSPFTIWEVASGDTMSEEFMLSKEPRYCPEQTMTLHREWIVDLQTNKVISKIPSSIHVTSFTSWCRLFAIGTAEGQLLILHCPLGEGPIPDVATST